MAGSGFGIPQTTGAAWFEPDARFIYLLEQTERGNELLAAYHDVVVSAVVIAADSKEARKLVVAKGMDETRTEANFWLSPAFSKLTKIGLARKPNGHAPARSRVVVKDSTGW